MTRTETIAATIATGLVNCGVVKRRADDPWLMGPALVIAAEIERQIQTEQPRPMNRDPDLEAIRLQCLSLAVMQPGDPVDTADRMFKFVTGQSAKTPRQLIDAALEAANVR